MPIHEYVCTSCKHEFDKLQKMNAKPIRKCPECKRLKLQKKVSSGGFVLKGGGFHKMGHSAR